MTQLPILPGQSYPYYFPIVQAGTYWMHAHYGLEEQKLLTAPLILHEQIPDSDIQQVVILLSDFAFRGGREIFAELRKNYDSKAPPKMKTMKSDIFDVEYDAFLANSRALSDPEVVPVQPEKVVRLRFINGSSSTNFFLRLGDLVGEAIAADGELMVPVTSSQFELGIGNRFDILVRIPQGTGAYPILAQGEGTSMLTGLILATPGAKTPRISERTSRPAGAFSGLQQKTFLALHPLDTKQADRTLHLKLGGNMYRYIWTINDQVWPYVTPLMVKLGERVEVVFENATSMSHPMHLHGHVFEIMEINGVPFKGVKGDTVLVLPFATVKIQFDADNPGVWPLHCHNLYHQAAGMMTTMNYEGYPVPKFTKQEQEL